MADDRSDFIAFTGSSATGERIQAAAGMRKTALELGSISCTAIAQDASLTPAVFANCANAGLPEGGPGLHSIQRLYLQRDIAQEATEGFLKATAALARRRPGRRAAPWSAR